MRKYRPWRGWLQYLIQYCDHVVVVVVVVLVLVVPGLLVVMMVVVVCPAGSLGSRTASWEFFVSSQLVSQSVSHTSVLPHHRLRHFSVIIIIIIITTTIQYSPLILATRMSLWAQQGQWCCRPFLLGSRHVWIDEDEEQSVGVLIVAWWCPAD